MANCLVTGGAGFIGSHIVERLASLGHRVRVLDNLSTGNLRNLQPVQDRIEFVQGDVADPDVCGCTVQGIEWIFHEAAAVSVPFSIVHPEISHRANVDGTFNLLDAARRAKVQRFVYAASSSAYGDDPNAGMKREANPPRPLSPYAVSKMVGEYYCRVFALQFGLSTVALRYFNVFGPRQNPKSQYAAAIPAFATCILNDQPPTVYGDGEQTRDFTFVANVVDANLLAAQAGRGRPGVQRGHGQQLLDQLRDRPAQSHPRQAGRGQARSGAGWRHQAQPGGHLAGDAVTGVQAAGVVR